MNRYDCEIETCQHTTLGEREKHIQELLKQLNDTASLLLADLRQSWRDWNIGPYADLERGESYKSEAYRKLAEIERIEADLAHTWAMVLARIEEP